MVETTLERITLLEVAFELQFNETEKKTVQLVLKKKESVKQ